MKILSHLLWLLKAGREPRARTPERPRSFRAETRRHVATARALAKDYEALGWR